MSNSLRRRGTEGSELAALAAEDFWEIGASGTPLGRAAVFATVLERVAASTPDEWRCGRTYLAVSGR